MSNCIKCHAELPPNALYCHMCGKKQASEKRKALKRANGMGTVYRLQGRRRRPWVAAKNRVIIGYYERKKDALEALERLTGWDISRRFNMTFAKVFDAWKEEHYRTVSASAIETYDHAYKVFEPLHGQQFRSLKTADFQAVIDQHMGKAHSTVAKYKQLITQMSKWAIREEIIAVNLASFVKLPEQVKREKQTFTDEEIAALEQDGSETAKIILMLIYTGMRIGELFSLSVDEWHGTYVIGGEKTETGRNRIIPIRPEGRPLFAYFASHAEGPLLLSGYSGSHTPENFRRREYYRLLEKLGIRHLPPHSARHTFASWAVKHGIQPEVLRRILGHAKYSTTSEIYVHADIETLVRAVEPGLTKQDDSTKSQNMQFCV